MTAKYCSLCTFGACTKPVDIYGDHYGVDDPGWEPGYLRLQLSRATAERDQLREQLEAMRKARDTAVEIAENMHHALTNVLCRRCEDSVRVCDLEELDTLRAVGSSRGAGGGE